MVHRGLTAVAEKACNPFFDLTLHIDAEDVTPAVDVSGVGFDDVLAGLATTT